MIADANKEAPAAVNGRGQDNTDAAGIVAHHGKLSSRSVLALLIERVRGCSYRCVLPPNGGDKRLFPIAAEADFNVLIAGHFAGLLPPHVVECQNGNTWTEDRGRALAVCSVRADSTSTFIALDIDGPDHASGADQATTDRAAEAALHIMSDAGLSCLLATSGGGLGRHVWCPLPTPIPADAAAWIAALGADCVRAVVPAAAIEAVPACRRGGRIAPPGRSLTLPGGGWVPAFGGGVILAERGPSDDGADGIARLLAQREHVKQREERERAREETLRRLRVSGTKPSEVRSADVPLESVARTLGRVVREQGGELHIACPCHDGTVKVHPGKRVWSCFACDIGGVGDAASYMLARFLLNNAPAAEVFRALRSCMGVANG